MWHSPKGTGIKDKIKLESLERIQNKCLRVITGGYKATAIQDLQREANIGPLRSILDKKAMRHLNRTKRSAASQTIVQVCKTITDSIFQPRQGVTTPRTQKGKWLSAQAKIFTVRETKCWMTTATENQWEIGWRLYKQKKRHQTTATEDVNWRKLHIVHKVLVRPQSSLVTQLRTGIIGLRAFLYHMKVPASKHRNANAGPPDKTRPKYWNVMTTRTVGNRCSRREGRGPYIPY